ncbi:hypothetical protein [Natronobacterium gregoryi]|uniref:hypothetical protein n=1 Tax=Natronobacterium gregoryi TaxID=44930 RepID=UPI001E2A5C80|nr:hypothetical protein [Natronobacterium gregoryi]
MNRRTVLQSAGVVAMTGLAGCLDGVQEHFGLQGVVPIEIENEADNPYNLQLEAYDTESGRQTYEESFSVTPQVRTSPQHLERTHQRFRIVRFDLDDEPMEVREVSITSETQLVTILLSEDDLVVDVDRGEAPGNETVTAPESPVADERDEDDVVDEEIDATNARGY